MKILIVDDNEDSRMIFKKILESEEHIIEEAINGEEALKAARKSPPDMIISDILMPVMDGFTLCLKWREDERLKDIPFIFYTATYTDEKDEELALQMGADRFIRKPIESDEFIKIIQGVIRDIKKGRIMPGKPTVEEEKDVLKLYSERLVNKLEQKMLDLEREVVERKIAERKTKHLNSVLLAIRNVNHLIITEKDRYRLIQGSCDNLTENRGYHNAWIALLNKSGKYVMSAESGLGKDFLPMIDRLKKNNLTLCGRKALSQPGVVVTENPVSDCADCPLSKKYAGRSAMTICLRHEGKIYGILSISISKKFVLNEEEQVLFKEVAGDIAFALHGIEMEENRKLAEEKIKHSLREKETLLAEIHHRVKNNMQIITSILSLQSKDIEDERALSLIKNCEGRIKSMSLVHEKLYLSKDLSRIDFHGYMEDLSARLFQAHTVDSRIVSFSSHIKDVSFSIETAIPLGLIANELISNAMKHAFPEDRKGSIAVELTQDTNTEEYTLTVADDGIGFSEETDYKNTETFGLRLVNLLADQLGGTMELDRSKGTSYRIIFKAQEYRRRM